MREAAWSRAGPRTSIFEVGPGGSDKPQPAHISLKHSFRHCLFAELLISKTGKTYIIPSSDKKISCTNNLWGYTSSSSAPGWGLRTCRLPLPCEHTEMGGEQKMLTLREKTWQPAVLLACLYATQPENQRCDS